MKDLMSTRLEPLRAWPLCAGRPKSIRAPGAVLSALIRSYGDAAVSRKAPAAPAPSPDKRELSPGRSPPARPALCHFALRLPLSSFGGFRGSDAGKEILYGNEMRQYK
ncbi:hypothetical protein EVAR_37763_1 [Eumeta japonica]|uniref:Uncharacterized protein n=1 Tax=Eumeta variegata TaxID=151549 RepID=A0A4C1WQI3_EUMVA|nr:hypothetical protein EVAR_37763_1 [Eumeta japonica]